MNPIFAAALEVQAFCESKDWRFCIIGALAVQRWGEPRLTRDVDLTVLSGFGSEERWIEPLLEQFRARRADVLDFALRTRVVLLEASNKVRSTFRSVPCPSKSDSSRARHATSSCPT